MPVLIVEDNTRLSSSLARGFREDGIETECLFLGNDALARFRNPGIEILILDLGLPDLDGIEVIRTLRGRGHQVPILVLTARDAVDSRVLALSEGADDYLLKPFSFDELLARVKALIRRSSQPRYTPLASAGISFVPDSYDVIVEDRTVSLSPREHGILSVLLSRQGETVPRADILSEALGYSFDPKTNLIDVHMTHLRQKLSGARIRIETVRGIGFRLMNEAAAGDSHA